MNKKELEEIGNLFEKKLEQHHINKTEVYMKKHYLYLNQKFPVDFDNDSQVEEFKGALRLVMKIYRGIEKASSIIGTFMLLAILSGFGYIIKLGFQAYTKIK